MHHKELQALTSEMHMRRRQYACLPGMKNRARKRPERTGEGGDGKAIAGGGWADSVGRRVRVMRVAVCASWDVGAIWLTDAIALLT